ncbi:hypothetical protein GQ457_06G019560 [Hibiscus cannabinus]
MSSQLVIRVLALTLKVSKVNGGEKLVDSSEDKIEDPDLTCDDLGNEPIFYGGEFVSIGDNITWCMASK